MSVQSDRASSPESTAVSAVPTQGARRDWLRHWELWVALAVGAFLRLWQPGAGQFLGDQAGLMSLASQAVQRGAVPVTGIHSSINTLNPPFSVYVLLPFVWLSHDPLLAVISQECWNVAGSLSATSSSCGLRQADGGDLYHPLRDGGGGGGL